MSHGVTLHSQLTRSQHIPAVCKASYLHLGAMRHVRSRFPLEFKNACSVVGAKLDYCNLLLYDTKKSTVVKLQRVQNSLAGEVTETCRFYHINLPRIQTN